MTARSSLSFLSWNLAMLERSNEAPSDWTQEHTQAEFREIVLELSPDVVLLQELPGLVPYVETHDMIRANPMTHSGNLATLVGHHLMDEQPSHVVVGNHGLLTTFPARALTIANVHLAPGRAEASRRRQQLSALVKASPTADLVIVGDTNTRVTEEQDIAALGLRGARPPEPTWDGHRNRFRAGGAAFVAFFTRYFINGAVRVEQLQVLSDRAVATEHGRFHLSDHFAITGRIVGPG